MYEAQCLNAIRDTMPKLTNTAKLKTGLLTIWNDLPWSSSTGQSYNFTADFDHGFLQLVDIVNTLFTELAADH